ncbi:hypothetical protein RM549_03375 [Salegentibacter sp. F188]|uniref:Uncharacterized protein n=1 Tax=Autumnicola patrickiae TaxID=3075591 RepID=A0ABU3DYK2_9FLAO|nr:hypothetical protein [Salegentibacter sp. F188]MDT0688807.1 hypothetical protein [Salegentibacter sp. F188]
MTLPLLILNVLLFFATMLFLYQGLLGILRRIAKADNVLDTIFVIKLCKSMSLILGVYSIRLIYLHKENIMEFLNEWLVMVIYADAGIIGVALVISYNLFIKKFSF